MLELASIYQAYWNKLDALGCIDERRLAYLARETLFSGKSKLKLSSVVIDGFDRISPLQADIFRGIANYATIMRVVFDHKSNGSSDKADLFDQYQWKQQSYNLLVNTLAPEIRNIDKDSKSHNAQIQKFSAADRFAEIQEITRRLKRAIVFDKRRPNELLVVAHSLTPYRAAIEAAFEEAQLPYFIDDALSLTQLPLVKFILKLLALSITDFKRKDVISCLRSNYLNHGPLTLSDADIDELDNKSYKFALVSGKQQWQTLSSKQCALSQSQALEVLFTAVTPDAGKHSLSKFCRWTEDLLEALLYIDKDAPVDISVYKDHKALAGIKISLPI